MNRLYLCAPSSLSALAYESPFIEETCIADSYDYIRTLSADNFVTNSGSGGNTYASDDIVGVHHPRVKVEWGVDGVVVDTSASNPMPVVQTGALPAGTANIGDVDVLTLPALVAGTANIGDVDVLTLPALPTGGNAIGTVGVTSLPSATNAGTTAKTLDYDTGAGTDTLTIFGLALPASGGSVAGGTATNPLRSDPTGTTTQPVSGTVTLGAGLANVGDVDVLTLPALPAGTNNIGDVDVVTLPALVAGTANIGDVDVLTLPALVAGTANIGDVDVLTLPALVAGTANIGDVDVLTLPALVAGTANIGDVDVASVPGVSMFRSLDLDETEEEVKATAGKVYGWWISNRAAAERFFKFYNATAATVVVGTTTPVMTLPLPSNSADKVAANMLGGVGINFTTAITVAVTTGIADSDVGAPGVNDVVCNLFFT